MVKKVKLTPEQVAAYEKLSGFKTTGDVELQMTDDAVWDMYERILSPLNDSKPTDSKTK